MYLLKSSLTNFMMFTLSLLLFYSCDKCNGIACTTPPNELAFVIVDNTDQDIISSTLAADDISITNDKTNKNLQLAYNNNIFLASEIGWETGSDNTNYTLHIADQSYQFIYHTESKSVDCCDLLGDLEEFSSDDFEIIEGSNGKYHYTLKIP